MVKKKILILPKKGGNFYFLNLLTKEQSSFFKIKIEGLQLLLNLKEENDLELFNLLKEINSTKDFSERKILKEKYKKKHKEFLSDNDVLTVLKVLLKMESIPFYKGYMVIKTKDALDIIFETHKLFLTANVMYKKLHYNSGGERLYIQESETKLLQFSQNIEPSDKTNYVL